MSKAIKRACIASDLIGLDRGQISLKKKFCLAVK